MNRLQLRARVHSPDTSLASTLRFVRPISHHYGDPLDRIWIETARLLGLRVERTPDAYATSDGKGVLSIASDEHLDPDDSLAQMIFHELCHSLVEGPDSFEQPDWGLDNRSDQHDLREHACLRVQAALTRPLGLDRILAPTTDFRASFWDDLGEPFEGSSESVRLARQGFLRAERSPWAPHLQNALEATMRIAQMVASFEHQPSSLWSELGTPRARHPVFGWLGTRNEERCGSCGFARSFRSGLRCEKSGRTTRESHPACDRWESPPSCETCGACCREAFDTLLLERNERVVKQHPELVVLEGETRSIPRPTGLCPALDRPAAAEGTYRCTIYEDRPRTCRDFTRGSTNCVLARRRVGLSI